MKTINIVRTSVKSFASLLLAGTIGCGFTACVNSDDPALPDPFADKAPAGAEAVDLGLPSGTKWANMDVGAEQVGAFGLFFAWGETEGYGRDTNDGRYFYWTTYKYMIPGGDSELDVSKYQLDDGQTEGCWYDANGNFIGDGKSTLDPEDDAAHVNWGGKWVMPTYEETQELIANTTREWTTVNGNDGYRFTSNINGNSIFIPAAGVRQYGNLAFPGTHGYVWTASLLPSHSGFPYFITFDQNNLRMGSGHGRGVGRIVRPVQRKEEKAPAAAEAIDLGMPSGTKWANMNLGAETPEGDGLYFAWGETRGYTSDTSDGRLFDIPSYKWMNQSQPDIWQVNKYQIEDGQTEGCWYDANGNFIGDGKRTLEPADDAAHVIWGGQWVMPTYEEMQELLANTTSEWTTQNGVNGRRFTSKINGNSIFLPAAGTRYMDGFHFYTTNGGYWSATVYVEYSYSAHDLGFGADEIDTFRHSRAYGRSIRPVIRN